MSHQQILKKLRKEMRKDINAKYKGFRDYLREKKFWERLRILCEVLFKP